MIDPDELAAMDRIDRRYEGRVAATLTGDRTVVHLVDGQLDYGTLELTVDRAGIRVVYMDEDTYDAIEGDPATDSTFDADLARWPAGTRSLLNDDRYAAVLQAGPPHVHGLHLSAVRVDARPAAAAPAGGERRLDPTSLRRLWGPLVEWYRTTGGGHVTVTKGPWRCVQFTGDPADGHVTLEVVVRHGELPPPFPSVAADRDSFDLDEVTITRATVPLATLAGSAAQLFDALPDGTEVWLRWEAAAAVPPPDVR